MNKKYVMFDLDDERILSLSNVLSNKTCKKILEYLADKEASETEISYELKLPANTVNYNIKQLLESGFIEKTKDSFWSVKGALAAVLVTAIGAIFIKVYSDGVQLAKNVAQKTQDFADAGAEVLSSNSDIITSPVASQFNTNWEWFLLGGMFALVIYFLIIRLKWFR